MEYRENSRGRGPVSRTRAGVAAVPQEHRRNYGFFAVPLLLIALMVLSACATISKEECLAADWYTKGVEDGSKGYPMSRIGNYSKDCAEVGVAPDADQYAEGRDHGLEFFCTYERGYQEGKRGSRNQAVCPPGQLEAEFMQGYKAGHYIYEVNQNIRSLERELAKVQSEVDEIRGDMDNGYRIDSSGNKHEIGNYERDAMYERLLALGKEEGRLEGEISTLRNSISGS
jgi:hypothetical protein